MAVLLVASSYVTWTYQTHTFSNAVETLVVAWSLVLIERIVDTRVRLPPGVCRPSLSSVVLANTSAQQQTSLLSSGILGIVSVFGLFNRITFPAFLLIPGLRLVAYFFRKYAHPILWRHCAVRFADPFSIAPFP